MERKDYSNDIKTLHNNVVAEIKMLMTEHHKVRIDLAGSDAPHAFIIGVPDFDWDTYYIEAEVLKVQVIDGKVELDISWNIDTDDFLNRCPNTNDDIGELYAVVEADDFTKLIPCAGIDSVYEAVFEHLEYGYTGDYDVNEGEEF